ncbi:MAG: GNAT family N-acetyltransferase [Acholeplasmataceae bacterium]
MILLKPVSSDNVIDVIKLSKTLDDVQQKQVAPNEISLAQAYAEGDNAFVRAIYHGDTLVGFIQLKKALHDVVEEDKPVSYIWRFMIAKDHQQQGYGKSAIKQIINIEKQRGIKTLYVSVVPTNDMPKVFYESCGFVNTGEIVYEELLLTMRLN